ncbi:YDG domain-containing protein [Pseudotenacibaculum sp. MALMAid0570]|uniref:YDG domain-containing protein n=1 Tax=Pseudotenacibaculum sp. MALMAid0570 TaxID=3143938 RepID=UPI0032DEB38C
MKNITRVILSLALTTFFYGQIYSQNQNGSIDAPGDIAFVAYHADNGGADQEDGFSFILLDDAPHTTAIRFIDEEWDGSLPTPAFIDLVNEGEVLWQNLTGATISAGTVITITDADGSGTAANIGTATEDENGFNLGSSEDFFAIIGTRASPTAFLTAHDGNDGNTLDLNGTSLTTSQVLTTTGQGRYTGSTTCNSSIGDCLDQIYNTTNWTFGEYTHSGTVVSDFTGSAFSSCAAPTAQATGGTFGSETSSTLNLTSFIAPAGGATGYAIYINEANSFTAPSDGDEPTADTSWNDSGQQPIYFGTSASPNVTVTGLDPGTTYYFQVYAYNDCSGTETYETTGLNINDTSALGVLTITGLTGNDKVYDGTNVGSATGTATLSGVASGANNVTLGGSPVFTFASANVGTGITINTSGYTISGTDAGKYTLHNPLYQEISQLLH